MSVRRTGIPAALAAAAAIAATPAAASAASAATINLDRPCYDSIRGAVIAVTGAGFTPGETIDLNGNEIAASATADPSGAFVTAVRVPILGFPGPGQKPFSISAIDESTGATVANASFLVANYAVTTKPSRAKPHKKVKYSFSGFIPGRPVFGHFVLHGKLEVTKRFGTAKGACGLLSSHSPLYPGNRVRYGTYRVQFDSTRKYSKKTAPRLVTSLQIFRALHF
jgi:hypothetical protein